MTATTNQLQAQLTAHLAATDAWTREVRAVFARAKREGRSPSHNELMHLIDSDPRPHAERNALPS